MCRGQGGSSTRGRPAAAGREAARQANSAAGRQATATSRISTSNRSCSQQYSQPRSAPAQVWCGTAPEWARSTCGGGQTAPGVSGRLADRHAWLQGCPAVGLDAAHKPSAARKHRGGGRPSGWAPRAAGTLRRLPVAEERARGVHGARGGSIATRVCGCCVRRVPAAGQGRGQPGGISAAPRPGGGVNRSGDKPGAAPRPPRSQDNPRWLPAEDGGGAGPWAATSERALTYCCLESCRRCPCPAAASWRRRCAAGAWWVAPGARVLRPRPLATSAAASGRRWRPRRCCPLPSRCWCCTVPCQAAAREPRLGGWLAAAAGRCEVAQCVSSADSRRWCADPAPGPRLSPRAAARPASAWCTPGHVNDGRRSPLRSSLRCQPPLRNFPGSSFPSGRTPCRWAPAPLAVLWSHGGTPLFWEDGMHPDVCMLGRCALWRRRRRSPAAACCHLPPTACPQTLPSHPPPHPPGRWCAAGCLRRWRA